MRAAFSRTLKLYRHQLFWPVFRIMLFAILIFIALTQYIIGWAYLSPVPGVIPVGQSANFKLVTNHGELHVFTYGAYRLHCEGDPHTEGYFYPSRRFNNGERIILYACTEGTGQITLIQPGYNDVLSNVSYRSIEWKGDNVIYLYRRQPHGCRFLLLGKTFQRRYRYCKHPMGRRTCLSKDTSSNFIGWPSHGFRRTGRKAGTPSRL